MTHTPLAYRPDEDDDWGFIRDSNGHAYARAFPPRDTVHAKHLKQGTDPAEERALTIVTAVNSHDALKAQNKAMRDALHALYKEAFDALSMFSNNPNDKLENQKVFKQARAAIKAARRKI